MIQKSWKRNVHAVRERNEHNERSIFLSIEPVFALLYSPSAVLNDDQ